MKHCEESTGDWSSAGLTHFRACSSDVVMLLKPLGDYYSTDVSTSCQTYSTSPREGLRNLCTTCPLMVKMAQI